jgi:hypothetical protein
MQADLARVLASSRESVSRCLSEFERHRWIGKAPNGLQLLSVGALRAHADPAAGGFAREAMLRNALTRQAALAALLQLPGIYEPGYAHDRRLPTALIEPVRWA